MTIETKLQELRLTKRLENKAIELSNQYQVDTDKVELLPDQGLIFGGEGNQIKVTHTGYDYLIDVIVPEKVCHNNLISTKFEGAVHHLKLEKMKDDYIRYAIIDLASHLTSLGFRVWVSTGGTGGYSYLIYTDASGDRVAYVQWKLFEGYQVISKYRPSRQCGVGWCVAETTKLLPKDKWDSFLYAKAPSWANCSPVYVDIAEYLANSKHSNYQPASFFLGQ